MADNHTIARPYAQALFEVAQANDAVATFADSLGVARDLLSDESLAQFLQNPKLKNDQRLGFLEDLFGKAGGAAFAGDNAHGKNFLKILLENDRVSVLPEIADHFDALRASLENTVDAVVTSATELSDAQILDIKTALSQRMGRDVSVKTEIDKNLIGGAIIRAGDVVIDGSTRARLEGLAHALTK